MLDKVGSFQFRVESYVCDFTGKATLPIIGSFILQAATVHAEERGFGYGAISRDNTAWVLSRLSVRMDEYPNHNEQVIVETWVEDVSRFFTQRCFRFLNQNKEAIGYARSIWAAIDMNTRRPKDIPVWRPDLQDWVLEGKDCLAEKPAKIPMLNDVEPTMGYTVRYSDIDINKHMNSVKYIEHIINVFDLERFRNHIIHQFEIVYLSEGTFGEKLKLYRSDISSLECLVDTRRGDESVCRSRIIWK